MTFRIEDKQSLGIKEKAFLREYFKTKYEIVDSEKTTEMIKTLIEQVNKKQRYVLFAYSDENPQGLIIGRPIGETIDVTTFYIEPDSYSQNCGYRLVSSFVKKMFSLGFKYYRHEEPLPYNMEKTYQETLAKDRFMIYHRAEMVLEISEEEDYPIVLKDNYSIIPFTKDRLAESLQVIVDANKGQLDSKIYPEMNSLEGLKEAFTRITNNFERVTADLSPQIIFNDKIVGASIVGKMGKEKGYILEIVVHPKHQRKGLGKALMNKICLECSKAGVKHLALAVTKENKIAYELYKKIGFIERRRILSIVKHKNSD
ncbi:MAG: GNAT family N-acetyltransferase [Candidatus Heimdallarchaeota archaeon]|nr:GNAT family N-acetyltransferase [Candidatus Heimdallarchaeota archaeon]